VTPLDDSQVRQLLLDAAAGPTSGDFASLFQRAQRSRRRRAAGLTGAVATVAAGLIAIPLLLTSGDNQRAAVVGPPPSQVAGNPLELVGRWSVHAAGEASGTSLVLGKRVVLMRRCGQLEGNWGADPSGVFVGSLYSGDGTCFHGPDPLAAPWLTGAVGFRVQGPDRLLVGRSGGTLATLVPASPSGGPKVTPSLRTALAMPAPLPRGVTPVTASSLRGDWFAIGPHEWNRQGSVSFATVGWSGSDGCNGYGGGLAVGVDGDLMTTSGASTLVGCQTSPAPDWVMRARRAGLSHGLLLLYDAKGTLLGRLARSTTAVIHGVFEQVGGPPLPTSHGGTATRHQHLSGTIEVHAGSASGEIVATTAAHHGTFSVSVPPGRYILVGVTGAQSCPAFHPATLLPGQSAHINVICEVP
jgi:hypothetical protein